MSNTSTQFIQVIDGVYSHISDTVIGQAKKCFIDYLAVTLSGAKSINQDLYENAKLSGGSSFVFGHESRTETADAICLNAYAAHALELDDGHRAGMMHLAAPIFSALLPVAETINSNLFDFLKAAAIGYEVSIRLAKTIQPEHKKRGFHCTGTCGTVGSAMSIAYLLNYTMQEKLNVLSASCTSAAGLLEVIMGQSQQKPYNIAHAAMAGYTAATFGKSLLGPDDILCGKRGFLSNFCDNPKIEKLLAKGDPEILGGYFKPYAACRHCHAPIEAALKARENGVDAAKIKQVIVSTYDLAVFGHDHIDIKSVNSAKMSTPYGVSIALLFGNAGMEMYSEQTLDNKAVIEMMKKVSVIEDPELSTLVPDKRAASIKIITESNEDFSYRIDYALGEPENPVSLDALFEKFDSLLIATGYDENYVSSLHSHLSNIKENTTIKEIIAYF